MTVTTSETKIANFSTIFPEMNLTPCQRTYPTYFLIRYNQTTQESKNYAQTNCQILADNIIKLQ